MQIFSYVCCASALEQMGTDGFIIYNTVANKNYKSKGLTKPCPRPWGKTTT